MYTLAKHGLNFFHILSGLATHTTTDSIIQVLHNIATVYVCIAILTAECMYNVVQCKYILHMYV